MEIPLVLEGADGDGLQRCQDEFLAAAEKIFELSARPSRFIPTISTEKIPSYDDNRFTTLLISADEAAASCEDSGLIYLQITLPWWTYHLEFIDLAKRTGSERGANEITGLLGDVGQRRPALGIGEVELWASHS